LRRPSGSREGTGLTELRPSKRGGAWFVPHPTKRAAKLSMRMMLCEKINAPRRSMVTPRDKSFALSRAKAATETSKSESVCNRARAYAAKRTTPSPGCTHSAVRQSNENAANSGRRPLERVAVTSPERITQPSTIDDVQDH